MPGYNRTRALAAHRKRRAAQVTEALKQRVIFRTVVHRQIKINLLNLQARHQSVVVRLQLLPVILASIRRGAVRSRNVRVRLVNSARRKLAVILARAVQLLVRSRNRMRNKLRVLGCNLRHVILTQPHGSVRINKRRKRRKQQQRRHNARLRESPLFGGAGGGCFGCFSAGFFSGGFLGCFGCFGCLRVDVACVWISLIIATTVFPTIIASIWLNRHNATLKKPKHVSKSS